MDYLMWIFPSLLRAHAIGAQAASRKMVHLLGEEKGEACGRC